MFDLGQLLEIAAKFGLTGLVLILWFVSMKQHEKTMNRYRDDNAERAQKYEEGMTELRRMYENNVELVRRYQDLAKDLKEVLVLNTTINTRLVDKIDSHQYCPLTRVTGPGMNHFTMAEGKKP